LTDSEVSIHASPWPAVPVLPHLEGGHVHVWRANVAPLSACVDYFDALIDDAERTRGAAFHAPADRLRHLVTRALLRFLGGHYLGTSPAALRFELGRFGKPGIATPRDPALQFNISHSGDIVLLAFAREGDVGVDVERWQSRMGEAERSRVGESVFSKAERSAIHALSSSAEREMAFYTLWSRKEAYLKGTGAGIAGGLSHVDVAVDAQARLIADDRDARAAERWTLRDIDVGPGYSAALASSPPGQAVVPLTLSPHLFDG